MKNATSNLVDQQQFYSSKKNTVTIDDDILLQSSFGFETKVNMGEKLVKNLVIHHSKTKNK